MSFCRKKGDIKRRIGTRTLRPKILILCEGENTEKLYFDSFRKATVRVIGTGMQGTAIIDEASRLKKSEEYEVIWCVYDLDSHPKDGRKTTIFDNSIQQAAKSNINVAYSNECFEHWILLHFDYSNAKFKRRVYKSQLSKYLKVEYSKTKEFCRNLYNLLEPGQKMAIGRAKKLEASYKENIPPSKRYPVTTVYALVEYLNTIN